MELFNTALFSDANLLSYYRLEDITDSKGSADLTNYGTVAFNVGKYNNGADFETPNSSRFLRNTSLLGTTATADRTIVGWIKPTANPGNGTRNDFIYFGYAGNKRGYYLGYSNTGGSYYLHGGGFRDYVADYLVNFASGVVIDWVHLALTYSGTALEFFVNGVSKGTTSMPSGDGNTGNTAEDGISIGRFVSVAPNYANGLIDDVAIFDRVLTAAEILTLVEETPTDPGLFDFNG
jgi:hypothetical protein